MVLQDVHRRPLRNLRLSVTDRCNLRCSYCMPEASYVWLPHEHILTFEETTRLVGLFVELGVDRLRLTGGEPLLRKDLPELVAQLAALPGIRDRALTTNGVLLARHAEALRDAGLDRVTVSLDSLEPGTFRALTRRDDLGRALEGIAAARDVWGGLKIDTVVMGGVNDRELVPLIEYGRTVNAEVRFIEYMDVGGATRWSMEHVVPRRAILERLERHYGAVEALPKQDAAPADRFRLPDGTTFGVISSTTQPFCATCDRSRLTADGHWFLCLYARQGIDLLTPLRRGAGDDELRALLTAGWRGRSDRGAEERKALRERGALAEPEELRADPHLEMHTRGG